jgi:ubiquinol-cytochrome c reductase cytochrome b subunit
LLKGETSMAEQQSPDNRPAQSRIVRWLSRRFPWDTKEMLRLLTITSVFYGPVDRRLHLRDAIDKMLKKPVPKHLNWTFTLGACALFLFMVQAFTGVLLSFYYKPSPESAYESVQHIMVDVRFGWLIRQIHAWGANLMVAIVFLHMLRVFFYGSYKAPREMTWMVGVGLLFLTLTFAFTGYLLPWNQLAYWATTVGTEILASIPLIGKPLLHIARGGETVSGETLSRFYAVHTIILPGFTTMMIMLHLFMVRRQGISEPFKLGEHSSEMEGD